ncbi:MAG: alanine racemase [Planctomycetes bacterium]|nr:alanine racemase [Planctomycetota bacterium]
MPTAPTSWLEIRLDRLEQNLAAFRAVLSHGRAPGRVPRLCAVVKADAYGLGMEPIARRLVQRGVDMLAVFSPTQAERLAALSLDCPILVLMRMTEVSRNDPLYRYALTGKLHLTIHDRPQLLELNKLGQMQAMQVHVQLYLDTGMSRGGLRPDQLADLLDEMPALRHVKLTGVYTHPSSADTDPQLTAAQMGIMDRVLHERRDRLPRDMMVHLANTHATLRDPRLHRSMVRVGLGLFGYGAEDLTPAPAPAVSESGETLPASSPAAPHADAPALQPVLRWLSRIIHVTHQPAGARVGYGGTHTLTRDSVLGLVPVGFADGYPRALSNRGVVALPGMGPSDSTAIAPILGRVNMDQIVIDLTNIAAFAGDEAVPGVVVELISDRPGSPCGVHALAKLADTSAYEILCRLQAHLPRRYL